MCLYCHEAVGTTQTFVMQDGKLTHLVCWLTVYRCQLEKILEQFSVGCWNSDGVESWHERLLADGQEVLCPTLHVGDRVVADHRSAHKAAGV